MKVWPNFSDFVFILQKLLGLWYCVAIYFRDIATEPVVFLFLFFFLSKFVHSSRIFHVRMYVVYILTIITLFASHSVFTVSWRWKENFSFHKILRYEFEQKTILCYNHVSILRFESIGRRCFVEESILDLFLLFIKVLTFPESWDPFMCTSSAATCSYLFHARSFQWK